MLEPFRNLRPAFQAILLQLFAALAVYAAGELVAQISGFDAPLFWRMAAQGAVAAALSIFLKLPWWWCLIQLVFAPLAVVALALQLPGWLYLAVFLLLAFIFWNSADDRVPLYLTNRRTEGALKAIIGNNQPAQFIDLGSGLGGTSLRLAASLPQGHFQGVETAPFPLLVSKMRGRLSGTENVSFDYGNMWDWNLAPYDVVYCFLSPVPMARLFEKARGELAPGALFISNSFPVPGQAPTDVIAVDDGRKTELYLYRMP